MPRTLHCCINNRGAVSKQNKVIIKVLCQEEGDRVKNFIDKFFNRN